MDTNKAGVERVEKLATRPSLSGGTMYSALAERSSLVHHAINFDGNCLSHSASSLPPLCAAWFDHFSFWLDENAPRIN